MSALGPPFAVAALLLCVAALAKLRSPAGAVAAARVVGIPAGTAMLRVFALVELGIGAVAAVDPVPGITAAVACMYALFSGVSLRLASQRADCGCFGERDAPATVLQSLLSAALAVVAIAATAWRPHGIGWIFGHDLGVGAMLLLGIAGAVYASVVAYTDLPVAWGAWSTR